MLFGPDEFVDAERIAAFKDQLRQGAKEAAAFATRVIAHMDPRGQDLNIDRLSVSDALDRVADSANELHKLIDRTYYAHKQVSFPPTWKRALQALFS